MLLGREGNAGIGMNHLFGQIAARLERLGEEEAPRWNPAAFRFESPAPAYSGPDGESACDRLVRAPKPPLPDPRLVRTIIRTVWLLTVNGARFGRGADVAPGAAGGGGGGGGRR